MSRSVIRMFKNNGLLAAFAVTLIYSSSAHAHAPEPQQRLSTPHNQSSQLYEINQATSSGQAFYKDNNIWVCVKEFADLFGMSVQFIDGIQGVAAVAFRIEDASGGRVEQQHKPRNS